MGAWRLWCTRLGVALAVFGATVGAGATEIVLKVGVYDNPPKIFLDKDGQATGTLIAVLKEIAKAEGWTLQFQPCQWESCLSALERGEIDLMPDVARTPERETRFDFHGVAALSSWSQLYRRPETKIESVLDLQGKRIAVLARGVQRDALRNLLEGFGVSANLVDTPTVADAFSAVQNGNADAAAASYHFGDYRAAQYGLLPTTVLFQPAKLYFASPKGRGRDVLTAIDQQLDRWQQDAGSPYYAILRDWSASPSKDRIPAWLVKTVLGMAVVLAAFAAIAFWLRRRVQQAVAQVQTKTLELEATLRAVPDLMFELDAQGNYLQVHAQSSALLAASRAQLSGKRVADVLPPEAAATVMQAVANAFQSGHSGGEQICLTLPDGPHWFELSTARMEPMPGRSPSVIMLSREVTQRVQDLAEIQRLADFDHLTGLPNRAQLRSLYQSAAARATRHKQSFAVVFLDIDHFKNINDSLGHAEGDKLLMEVAQRLRSGLRDTDIACRIGGDEFVLVFDDVDADGAVRMASRLQQLLHASFDLGPYQSGVTVSIGVAMYPDDGPDLDTLLRNADSAMYQAKTEGRNAVRFFTAAVQARAERLLELSGALSLALERHELHLLYQPVVRLDDGKVIGAEALLRWSHPVLGMVSPAEFIPVAESAGHILSIGEWVLQEACRQAVAWDFAGRGWVMAVNVSVIQFRQDAFVPLLDRLLRATGLAAHCLELELTESVAMGDANKAVDTMQQLRALGVRIAIDDFGTGYSSMAYLRRLGFHKLKIDQSFVRNIGRDSADESIITAMVQLARSLGIETLAEGVETAAQQAFLQQHGCDFQQGWLFAKATAPADWGRWLQTEPSSV